MNHEEEKDDKTMNTTNTHQLQNRDSCKRRGCGCCSRLLCTVSGGLEAFAEREARQQLPDAAFVWLHRGNSGSQLEICFHGQSSITTLIGFRFVEYVYAKVGSADFIVVEDNKEDLIQKLKDSAATILQSDSFNASTNLWRIAQTLLSDRRDLGLEALPGVLMPTLKIRCDDGYFSEHRIDTTANEFVVNTIYTKSKVAEAVVGLFLDLVETISPELSRDRVLWLDAGAGSGALLQYLPLNNRIGIDIQPSSYSGVHLIDFFAVTKKWLQNQVVVSNSRSTGEGILQPLCIISNPPFAENSRGDYSAIVKFINHAIELDAMYVGMIVPDKFARQRVWQSLGMNPRARLLARCLLPNDSFYDPSTRSCRHINSYFLLFGVANSPARDEDSTNVGSFFGVQERQHVPRIQIEGNRNKGDFPWISTTELRDAVACSLDCTDVTDFNDSDETNVIVSATLKAVNKRTSGRLELYVLLNHKQPLSLANCISRRISSHSLGWLSNSTKPPIAFAMCNLALTNARSLQSLVSEDLTASTKASHREDVGHTATCALVINAMCGEGTIEIESQECQKQTAFFMIAGDKSEVAVKSTGARLSTLYYSHPEQQGRRLRPLVDMVVWDAQRLPLRSGIADVYLADLPFGGSKKKNHQEPCLSGGASDNSLDYKCVMSQAVRVLKCKGRAAFLSSDTKALSYTALQLNPFWSVLYRNNLNLGGLPGKLFLLERHKQCSKDLSVWISNGCGSVDESDVLHSVAIDACRGFRVNDFLEIYQCDVEYKNSSSSLVAKVELISSFFNSDEQMLSHCYRVWFGTLVSNLQAKQLEKRIRTRIKENPPSRVLLR